MNKNHFALTFVLSLAWMCYLRPAVDASQILNKVKEKITWYHDIHVHTLITKSNTTPAINIKNTSSSRSDQHKNSPHMINIKSKGRSKELPKSPFKNHSNLLTNNLRSERIHIWIFVLAMHSQSANIKCNLMKGWFQMTW